MRNISKTLFIPLYGKAMVSRKGIILQDKKAEEIWDEVRFPIKGKSASKWLAYYMGMRAKVFDTWVEKWLEEDPSAVVLHLGCGMDSRVCRIPHAGHKWFDVDFPDVIDQRKAFYATMEDYTMLPSDARDTAYLEEIPKGNAIIIMEGISMYLQMEELKQLLSDLCTHFAKVQLLMDCYTVFAAKASKYKNPVNEVGVTTLYGIDDPQELEGAGLQFVKEQELTPDSLINQLTGMERLIFQKLYAGSMAKKMYRLYEFSSKNP